MNIDLWLLVIIVFCLLHLLFLLFLLSRYSIAVSIV
jgi:hypothetical protein